MGLFVGRMLVLNMDKRMVLDIVNSGWTFDGPIDIEDVDEHVEEYSNII